jgi:hypothetical protein
LGKGWDLSEKEDRSDDPKEERPPALFHESPRQSMGSDLEKKPGFRKESTTRFAFIRVEIDNNEGLLFCQGQASHFRITGLLS